MFEVTIDFDFVFNGIIKRLKSGILVGFKLEQVFRLSSLCLCKPGQFRATPSTISGIKLALAATALKVRLFTFQLLINEQHWRGLHS